MRKGNLCFVLLCLVLFYWPNPALSHTDLFDKIDSKTINLLPRGDELAGDEADVYYPVPEFPAADDAFPIVAVLQGAFVDKQFYSEFGTQLARFGFVVVIPNHLVVFGPPNTPPAPFPDEFVIIDVLETMKVENEKALDTGGNPNPLFGIIDTTRMGLSGHSAGGAASLFALSEKCVPPFCIPIPPPPFFTLPEAVRAGAFYGTNSFGPDGNLIEVDTDDFPVALVQGTFDGIATPEEAKATFNILDGVRALIPIYGANHYGITNFKNAPRPNNDPNESDPDIGQTVLIKQIANATGQFLRTHVSIELSVSSAKDRADTTPLEGATLSGNAYVFLTPLIPDGDIDQVDFFLDGSFVKTESWAPYDLKGTYSTGRPAPFNTRTLKDGSHIVRAEIVFPSGVQSITSTFETLNYEPTSGRFNLSVSFSADRSGTMPLEGATLSGDAFIFLTPLFPDGDIDKVKFFLDGSFVKTESWAPYDLKGTYDSGRPARFDTRTLDDGSHSVRAEIVFAGGEVEAVASSFLVFNDDDDDDDYDDDDDDDDD